MRNEQFEYSQLGLRGSELRFGLVRPYSTGRSQGVRVLSLLTPPAAGGYLLVATSATGGASAFAVAGATWEASALGLLSPKYSLTRSTIFSAVD